MIFEQGREKQRPSVVCSDQVPQLDERDLLKSDMLHYSGTQIGSYGIEDLPENISVKLGLGHILL